MKFKRSVKEVPLTPVMLAWVPLVRGAAL